MPRMNVNSLPVQVSGEMLRRIVDGEYAPGSVLPNEHEMAAEYGVSRIVIREAARLLSNKGVVDIRQGRSTIVAPKSEWDQLDPQIMLTLLHAGELAGLADDLLEMRKLLETEAIELAAARATDDDIQQLTRLLDQMLIAAHEDHGAYIVLEEQFHRRIWKTAGNRLFYHVLDSLSDVFAVVKQLVFQEVWEDIDRDHVRMLNAIRQHQPAEARSAMVADISRFEEEIRLVLARGLKE